MRKRSRLLSVAFLHLASMIGLCALPTVGQSASPVINWAPANSFPGKVATDLISTGTVPMWQGSDTVNAGPTLFNFAMVGKDPTAKSGAITVQTRIIPIRFTSATPPLVFDTENNDACSPRRTPALNMVQESPVFRTITLPGNLNTVGTGQFGSLFQRAAFSTFTQKGAVSPGYQVNIDHTLLNTEEETKHTLAIETVGGSVMPNDPNGCEPVAMIDVNQWETYLRGTVFPRLPRLAGPKLLLIFLFNNVVMFGPNISVGPKCCILSYHSAFPSPQTGAPGGQMQSYIVANYDSTSFGAFTGAFPTAPDITALANAVAGWINNPTTLNQTPGWAGTINGVTGCKTVLEVSDPPALSGKLTPITMSNKDVYHVQDLAFKSWFYGDGATSGTANSGFGGGYSLFGTFSVPNPPTCP
jgi:hypothetical protein